MVTDPADYRWSSDRANAFGASDALLSPHPLYLALGADDNARRAAYRELFCVALDEQPLSNRRLALNQNQPIGDARFYREIEAMTGQRWELRRRGRPRKRDDNGSARDAGGGELPRRQIDSDPDDGPQSMRFRSAAELTPKAVAAITEQVRIRVLRWFARSGLIERDDARDMLAWENSGFSLDAAVCVAANDRAGLERLLWPCVRLIHVRFVDHCCRPQPKRRCPFLAGCGRWGRPA